MNTYITVYKEDVKDVKLLLRDQYDVEYYPDTSTIYIKDSDDTVIIPVSECTVYNNTVSFTLSGAATEEIGQYDIVWKIGKNDEITHHVTKLTVNDI